MDNDDIVICISEFLSIPDTIQIGYTCRRLTRLCAEHILNSKFSDWERSCTEVLSPYVGLCDARMAQVQAEQEHRLAQEEVLTALRAEIVALEEEEEEHTTQRLQQRKRDLFELLEGQNRSNALWDAQCEAWLELRTAMEEKFAEKKQTSDLVMSFVTFASNMSSG